MMIVRGMTRMHDDSDDGVECDDDGTPAADADDYGGAMMMIKVTFLTFRPPVWIEPAGKPANSGSQRRT